MTPREMEAAERFDDYVRNEFAQHALRPPIGR